MSSISRLPKGQWRAQVRRKGRYVSQSFVRRKDAEEWALKMERRIDRGESVSKNIPDDLSTFSQLIDLHITDMLEVGKRLRRSKTYSLDKLEVRLGHVRLELLDRERIIQFARARRAEGAGLPVSPDQVDLARIALKRLGLVGKAQERDRRPTQEELDRLIAYFEANTRQKSPMARLVTFTVATAMRQSEICAIEWPDADERRRTVTVRDRKDPRNKDGNDQRVPLVDLTGYDA